MFFLSKVKVIEWYNRGDEDVEDWLVGDLVKDGNWHDLDLTSIIPIGASLVLIKIKASHTISTQVIAFRTKGVINDNAVQYRYTHETAAVFIYDDLMLQPDSNGIIQYKFGSAETWIVLSLRIMGWLK